MKLELELEDNYNTQKLKYLIGVQKQYRTFAQDYMYFTHFIRIGCLKYQKSYLLASGSTLFFGLAATGHH